MAEYVDLKDTKGPKLKLVKLGNYSFSTMELRHLLLALFMITITMMAIQKSLLSQLGYLQFTLVFFVTVGLGFLLHELGHKFVAQYYGYLSEFRADGLMLGIAFLLALVSPFVFIAPGAVMILGRPSLQKNGIISIAGPFINLVLATIFFTIGLFVEGGLLGLIVDIGVWVNAFLGVFNMLPFWILDGKKVLMWSKTAYFSVLIPLIILMFL